MTIQQEDPVVSFTLGDPGEPCAGCGAPLATDQRYCLDCGERRAGMRVQFMEILRERILRDNAAGGGNGDEDTKTAATGEPPRQRIPGLAIAGGAVGLFVLILGLGVLIGSLDQGDKSAPPQVISVGSSAPAVPTADQPFVSDWPEGQEGYAVQIQTLPKAGTQVAAVTQAKTAATGKGATEVGALDSDQYSSLPPGNYVIFAGGVFPTKKAATAALKDVQTQFPQAEVIKVSADGGVSAEGDADALSGKKKEATVGKKQLKELQGLSPEEYQKKAQKLPDTTKLPGQAPPKDKKKPGGSDDEAETIK